MKSTVKISTKSIVVTAIYFIIVTGVCLFMFDRHGAEAYVWVLFAIVCTLGALCLFYCPMYVEVDDKNLSVGRSLRIKEVPLSEIASVELWTPTGREQRIYANGGVGFGYWGWYSAPGIGKYFAYYGEPDNCFMVTLRDGRHYLLGCSDAREMVDALSARIS